MWLISYRELIRAMAVLLLGAGLMFFGAQQPFTQPAIEGSGFALMAAAGAFRGIAVYLLAGGTILILLSLIPVPRRKKPQPNTKANFRCRGDNKIS